MPDPLARFRGIPGVILPSPGEVERIERQLQSFARFWFSPAGERARLRAEVRALRERLYPEDPKRQRDLRLAARAACQIMRTTRRVTREAIFEILEKDEPGLAYDALLKRWERHAPAIRLPDILAAARDAQNGP